MVLATGSFAVANHEEIPCLNKQLDEPELSCVLNLTCGENKMGMFAIIFAPVRL